MITYIWMNKMQPEPWKAPGAQVGRRKGGMFASLIKDGRLTAYQEAIKESLEGHELVMYKDDEYLRLEMFFWRKLEEYTPTLGRKSKRKWADATNMGKALEDALQGVLYRNDSKVVCPVPRIIEQGDDTRESILIVAQPMNPRSAVWLPTNWHSALRSLSHDVRDVSVMQVQSVEPVQYE